MKRTRVTKQPLLLVRTQHMILQELFSIN
ncbi:hypothetical protein NC652_014617 [Populus alba x Populus x berolinensis]|uniref:Uncharacterized protein n=1 Tax=Populus alba x Populus x berolinensis TaxID=444605 RepID=A0AAD6W438_9ROSI|nr:hypothetical protein NC652_014617 [Populus alba x Populus x berolinensis]KAJ6998447.1 hypothetical protein NC653_014586 [Populus alba x Populus x berolinensis]